MSFRQLQGNLNCQLNHFYPFNLADQKVFCYSPYLTENWRNPLETVYEFERQYNQSVKFLKNELQVNFNCANQLKEPLEPLRNTKQRTHKDTIKGRIKRKVHYISAFRSLNASEEQIASLHNDIHQARVKLDALNILQTQIHSRGDVSFPQTILKDNYNSDIEEFKTSPDIKLFVDTHLKLLESKFQPSKEESVENAPEKNYFLCQHCSKEFSSTIALKGHVNRKHGKQNYRKKSIRKKQKQKKSNCKGSKTVKTYSKKNGRNKRKDMRIKIHLN